MTENDAKWLAAAGALDIEVQVGELRDLALWWAYELARNADAQDMRIDESGYFLIHLNDDVNAPGWYHYRKRAASDDEARRLVAEKLGERVMVPVKAVLSKQPVGIL